MNEKNPILQKQIDIKMGERWRNLRKRAGLTLRGAAAEFAKLKYPIQIASIQKFEQGKSQLAHLQAYILLGCKVYRTTPNEIFGATDINPQNTAEKP